MLQMPNLAQRKPKLGPQPGVLSQMPMLKKPMITGAMQATELRKPHPYPVYSGR